MNLTDTDLTKDCGTTPPQSRIALQVEYLGGGYQGWQRQKTGVSVQEKLESAVSIVANELITVVCAGRTDSGVHATCQIVHFDTHAVRQPHNWLHGINANLPHDVSVTSVQQVSAGFHARFSAYHRRYRYVIVNKNSSSAVLHKHVTWCKYPLDEHRMHQAAQALVGTHDFTSYRATGCQAKTAIRTLTEVTVTRNGALIYIDVGGNAFLHHMVRNIVGVLLEVGYGRQLPAWSHEVLAAKDRTVAAATAPAQGLYLVHVMYPPELAVEFPAVVPDYSV